MQVERVARQDGLEVWRADRPAWAALEALRDDVEARTALTRSIADAPFDGLFWECRGISASSENPFEFALIDSARVADLRANPRPFQAALAATPAGGVAAFDNLGGRSRLVAPKPAEGWAHGAHLAEFVRGGPADQIDALWRCVADEALRWARTRTLWLSTSGLGVSWLHVRLDPRPKYYTHAPYRTEQVSA